MARDTHRELAGVMNHSDTLTQRLNELREREGGGREGKEFLRMRQQPLWHIKRKTHEESDIPLAKHQEAPCLQQRVAS